MGWPGLGRAPNAPPPPGLLLLSYLTHCSANSFQSPCSSHHGRTLLSMLAPRLSSFSQKYQPAYSLSLYGTPLPPCTLSDCMCVGMCCCLNPAVALHCHPWWSLRISSVLRSGSPCSAGAVLWGHRDKPCLCVCVCVCVCVCIGVCRRLPKVSVGLSIFEVQLGCFGGKSCTRLSMWRAVPRCC